ncbi:MAG: hypothetical protein CM15mP103_06170 [Gammaproteobacteria bacterium]|nr:MAG: hypothetical protein CM15mP103_06170 [Gammaproteobacteria bacterium]
MERTALKDLSEQTIHYPVFGSGMATLDLLFYHEPAWKLRKRSWIWYRNYESGDDRQPDRSARNVVAVKSLEIDPANCRRMSLSRCIIQEAPFTDIESDGLYGADLVWRFVRTFPTMTMLAETPVGVVDGCHTDMTTLLPCSGYQLKPHLNFTARIPLPLTRLAIYGFFP